jgi:two-component system, NtrC family, sensor kinase
VKERLVHVLTSLTAKYVAIFTLLVAVPAIGISWYLLDSSYNDNRAALIRLQQENAKTVAALLREFLDAEAQKLRALGPVDYSTNAQLTERLALYLQASEALSASFYNAYGVLQAQAGTAMAPRIAECGHRFRRRLVDSAQSQGIAISPIFDCGIFGQNLRFAAGGNAGVFEEQLDAGILRVLLERTRVSGSGHAYAYAVDARGNLVADQNQVGEQGSGPRTSSLPQVKAAIESRRAEGWSLGRNANRERVVSAFAVVPPIGWRVIVEQPESAAFAPLRGHIWRTAFLIAAFMAVAVALSILLARRLVRPIKRMQVAAAAIGGGAYDERIELERKDELGALAQEFNHMAANLQESQRGLEQKVEERTHELQLALEQLAEKTRELEVASQHKSDFLANMSHELRTPLNAIVGFSQVLKQKLFGPVNEKQDEYLDDILSSADHLLALINDILDLSKVEAGQVELELGPFSLREALERGVVMIRERATNNGVALSLELDPTVDVVHGDERRILQVVFNLLSNAVKFTPEGGRVDVSMHTDNGDVLVAVRDTGPGISRADQARIFEEFQQARDSNGERPEGTGLGLALSRSLVELHGGRIWVESEPGKGSTFTFTIPVGSSS